MPRIQNRVLDPELFCGAGTGEDGAAPGVGGFGGTLDIVSPFHQNEARQAGTEEKVMPKNGAIIRSLDRRAMALMRGGGSYCD
jgi:hypothetical protein